MRLTSSANKSHPDAKTEGADSDTASSTQSAPPLAPQSSLLPLLSLERTSAKVSCTSRKRALEYACEILVGSNDLNARNVLDALLAREKLGSTALGEGVAIPHCRLPGCQAPLGVLLSLDEAVDYDAPDDIYVDLLFVLVVPESSDDQHLQLLSQLASILIEADHRVTLRQAHDHLTLFESMQKLVAATDSS